MVKFLMTVYKHQSYHHPMTVARSAFYVGRRTTNTLVLAGFDALAWGTAFFLASLSAQAFSAFPYNPAILAVVLTFWYIGAWMVKFYPGWGKGVVQELRLTTELGMLAALLTLLVYFFTEPNVLRAINLLLMFLGVPLLLVARNLAKVLLGKMGLWGVPVVIYGAAKTGQMLAAALQAEPGMGYRPIGFFDDDPRCRHTSIHGIPVLGDTSHQDARAPIAILAMPGAPRERNIDLLEGSLKQYHKVLIIPDLFDVQSLWAITCDLGGVLGLEITRNLQDPFSRMLKRAFDLIAIVVTLPLWMPLCLLIGLTIWLEDRQNPLFLQERIGMGGKIFKTWKFRTMFLNAEAILQKRLQEDPALRAEWEVDFKLKNDPRITRVGGFLRRTSLDEFPQLINVLLGDMSLVGPRPLTVYHNKILPERAQLIRQDVRPGVTGLWQVSGRSDSGTAGMARYDPYYVRNWSIWLDVVILVRTVKVVLLREGAY